MADNTTYLSEKKVDKKTNKLLNQFWAGFIVYTTSYTLMITGEGKNVKIMTYLQFLGILIFIFPATRLITFKIENKYLRNLFIIYCGWLFFVVANGFLFQKEFIFDTLVDSYTGLFLYLSPLILLFPKDLVYLKKIVNVIIILSIIYIICDLVFIKALLSSEGTDQPGIEYRGQTVLEYFSKNLGIPCGFILLIISYQRNKRKSFDLIGKLWPLCIMLLTLLLAVIRARRGLMFISINILFFAYIIYSYAHKNNLFFKFFPLFIVFFVGIYVFNIYTNKKSGTFSLINSRLTEDTRSGVEEYFYLDMNKEDWIIGRGIVGQYYSPSGATEDSYRKVIETDYLQIILKGGIISLGLLLLIAIPAIIKGIFYSKNILSKAAGIWILIWLLGLYPSTVTIFSLSYLLVWISIGICYSKEIRNIPEDDLREHFHFTIFNPRIYKSR